MKSANCSFLDKMADSCWLCDFAFVVGMLKKLNELNVKMRGKEILAHEL